MANKKELARRVAARLGYTKKDVLEVLNEYENVIVESLENGEEVKHGTLYKISLQELKEKKAWNGFDKVYFTREPKLVPKFTPLKKISDISLPVEKEEE